MKDLVSYKSALIAMVSSLLLLGAGCSLFGNSSLKCKTDTDCAPDICAGQTIVTNACQENTCVTTTTQCEGDQICVQDGSEIQCEVPLKATPDAKPSISCSSNSDQMKVTGHNAFNPSTYTCATDCPEGFICKLGTCTCEEEAKKKVKCEEPIFINNWDTASLPLFYEVPPVTFDELAEIAAGTEHDFKMSDDVQIEALAYIESNIPFPNTQFTVEPADDPFVVRGTYCANRHYEGPLGLDIEANWLFRDPNPDNVCGWGNPDSFDGVLVVCLQDLLEWYESYLVIST